MKLHENFTIPQQNCKARERHFDKKVFKELTKKYGCQRSFFENETSNSSGGFVQVA